MDLDLSNNEGIVWGTVCPREWLKAIYLPPAQLQIAKPRAIKSFVVCAAAIRNESDR